MHDVTSTDAPQDRSSPADGAVFLAVLALSGALPAALAVAWHDADMSTGRVVAGLLAVAFVLVAGLGWERIGRVLS